VVYARAAMREKRLNMLVSALALGAALLPLTAARAERSTLGPHVGFNFDVDDPFIGFEGRFDVGDIGTTAIVQINPSVSYYFTDYIDLLNFSLNVPFEFKVRGSVLRPFVAPGLGIWHRNNGRSDTDLALNLIGGLLFDVDAVEPFVQLRVSIGDGSTAELMGGLLIQL
jgi:hypothetical protein